MNKSLSHTLGLLIIVLFACFPFFGFVALKGLGRSAEQLTLLLGLLTVVMYLLEFGKLKTPRYIFFYALFLLYTVLSDIFLAGESLGFGYIRRNSFLGSLLILLIIENSQIEDKSHTYINKISYYTLFIALLVILIQQFVQTTFFTPSNVHRELSGGFDVRLPSVYAWVGTLAEIGISFFPILGIFIEKKIRKDDNFYFVLFFIGAVVAILNKSRFVLLNYMLLFFLLPIHKGWNINLVLRYTVIAVILLTGLYFGAKQTSFDVDRFVNERLLERSAGGIQHGSASSRIIAFEVFSKLFPENPIWGRGKLHAFGQGEDASRDITLVRTLAGRSSQIHVGYLSLLYYYGLMGGGLYILFVISLSKKLLKDAKKTGFYAPFIGWIMFIISNLTLVSLDVFRMGIVVILYYNKYFLVKNTGNNQNV